MLWPGCCSGYIREVDFCLGRARKFNFCFFCSFFEALECHGILAEINTLFLEEFIGKPIYDYMVEIVSAEVGIAVGGFNLKYAVAKFKDRNIECTATKVKHGYLLVLVCFVKTISQCRCGWFVNNTFNCEACNFSGLFSCLALRIVKICRYCNNSFCYSLAKEFFCGFLHLLENHRRNFLRCVFTSVYVNTWSIVDVYYFIRYTFNLVFNLVICFSHETFDRIDCTLRVCDGLTFCRIADFTFAAVYECHYRGCCVVAFAVRDNNRVVTFKNGYTGISRSQVYANNFSHNK